MKQSIVIIFIIFFTAIILLPLQAESADEYDLIGPYLESSFVTVAAGINFNRKGKQWDDQIFEGEINNHLRWFNVGERGMVIFNPKVKLRMYSEDSAPVRTPSFMPRLTYFYRCRNDPAPGKCSNYYSLMLSHHSNGQAGPFYHIDGTVNTKDGNFSTNFFEFAYYKALKGKSFPQWLKLALDWHPGFNREDGLDNQYETLKVKLEARSREWEFGSEVKKEDKWLFSYKAYLSYILSGRDYIVAPNENYPGINAVRAEWEDNIHLALEAHLKPSFFKAIRLFFKYDSGYDYYNIHFQEKINRLQFGFSGKN